MIIYESDSDELKKAKELVVEKQRQLSKAELELKIAIAQLELLKIKEFK